MSKSGKFISFEGIDGAGKSTHINWIKDWLKQKNINVLVVREPGSTMLGESLRGLLLEQTMCPLTETLLMFSARHELVEKIIKPNLAQGIWIVSDRFVDASYAYQGGGRNISIEILNWLKQKTVGEAMPNLTFLFSASIDTAEKRRNNQERLSNKNPDRFEKENNEFFNKVQKAYLQCQAQDPYRIININSEKTLEEIRDELAKSLEKLL